MKILILGSKEYPMGANKGEDPISSGGIETYNESLVNKLSNGLQLIMITRKFNQQRSYEKKGHVEVYRVPWQSGLWTRTPTFILNSFRLAKKLDFDMILAYGQVGTFFGIFLSKIKKKPLISVPHGLASKQPRYNVLMQAIGHILEKWTFSKAEATIALSTNDAKRLKQLNPKINLVYIPTGIDLNKFKAHKTSLRRSLGINPYVKIILSTSRLIKVKGLNYLLASVQKLKGDFVVLLAGSGPQEQELKKYASDKVRFLGFRKDIPDLLATADVFVLPSLSEGLPLSLLEAMASSCACIVTDIGLPVEHGKTGIIVPPADSDALAEALQRLLDDKRLREQVGKQARKFVEKFTWERTALMYNKLFTKLAK